MDSPDKPLFITHSSYLTREVINELYPGIFEDLSIYEWFDGAIEKIAIENDIDHEELKDILIGVGRKTDDDIFEKIMILLGNEKIFLFNYENIIPGNENTVDCRVCNDTVEFFPCRKCENWCGRDYAENCGHDSRFNIIVTFLLQASIYIINNPLMGG